MTLFLTLLSLLLCCGSPSGLPPDQAGPPGLSAEGRGSGTPICTPPLIDNQLSSVDLSPYTIEYYTSRGCSPPSSPLYAQNYGKDWCCPSSVCPSPLVDHRLSAPDLTPYTISYYTSSGCTAPPGSQYYGLVWCCTPECVSPYREHRLATKDLTPYTIDYYEGSGCVGPTDGSLYGLIWCCR